MPIELVVFDLAGTTVKDDKDVHRILQKALATHSVSVSIEDANGVMGIPKPVAIRHLLNLRYSGPKIITPKWIGEIHVLFVEEMIHFYRTDPSVGEKLGVTETFKKLKQSNLKVAVDTGFDRQITAPLLDRIGWKSLIDASVTSDEVERGRPHPDMIFRAMQLTNTSDARNVAKIGDTISDIEEGKAAGCGWVVGVTTGSFTREQLLDAKPTHLIENVSELLEILRM